MNQCVREPQSVGDAGDAFGAALADESLSKYGINTLLRCMVLPSTVHSQFKIGLTNWRSFRQNGSHLFVPSKIMSRVCWVWSNRLLSLWANQIVAATPSQRYQNFCMQLHLAAGSCSPEARHHRRRRGDGGSPHREVGTNRFASCIESDLSPGRMNCGASNASNQIL